MTVLATSDTIDNRSWEVSPERPDRDLPPAPPRSRWRWPYLVALLSWIVYSAAAIWMTEGLHLQLGDSIARMNDARAMLYSRDPHLAALGLYWMPLPTVGQLPFMLILSPLHHAELSGPLACAAVGALTVLVIARICWEVHLSKPLAIAFTLVYAFSPIVVYTNGNGMSEAWLFLTLAFSMLGLLRWSLHHRTVDLAVLSAGLAGVALARYEGFVLAPVIAVLAALNDGRRPPTVRSLRLFLADCRSRWRRWLTTASVVALPTYFVLALWMLMNYVIDRNPLYWYDLQKTTGHTTPSTYSNLPAHHPVQIFAYVVGMCLLILPGIAVVFPLLALRRLFQDFIIGFGILAGGLVWPLIVLAGLFANESAGAPRYFEPTIVFVVIGAIWLSASIRSHGRALRRSLPPLLIGVLILSALGGTIALENPRRTYIEQENQFFTRVMGHHIAPLAATALSRSQIWQKLAEDLDRRLKPGDKVLVDTSTVDFGAFIYTDHPGQYIVNSDRDYERTVADPTGKFDYLILASYHATAGGDLGTEYPLLQAILTSTTGGHWVKLSSYFVASVYRLVPDQPGP